VCSSTTAVTSVGLRLFGAGQLHHALGGASGLSYASTEPSLLWAQRMGAHSPPPLLPVAAPQLWFPSDYATTPSAFAGMSAMGYFTFLLAKLPRVAFTKDGVAGFDVTGVQARLSQRAGRRSRGQGGGVRGRAAAMPPRASRQTLGLADPILDDFLPVAPSPTTDRSCKST
jgi:hypothetical protein